MAAIKVKSSSTLANTLKKLRAKGKRIVFTNGCFDILHAGHVKYLKKARSLGDVLVVGLNSDSSVRLIKGEKNRPINNEKDRALLLSALYFVDYVVMFDEDTPEALIRKLKPDFVVKGGDWDKRNIVGGSFLRSYGGRVATIPFVKGYSTTSLIARILKKGA